MPLELRDKLLKMSSDFCREKIVQESKRKEWRNPCYGSTLRGGTHACQSAMSLRNVCETDLQQQEGIILTS